LVTGCSDILSIDELAPSSLQKAVTGFGGGKGVDKKQAMKDAVEKIYGELGLKKSDQYDAIGLALCAWWRSHSGQI
jgi:Holliday junction resolvasome RuvABC endonuclease subunit